MNSWPIAETKSDAPTRKTVWVAHWATTESCVDERIERQHRRQTRAIRCVDVCGSDDGNRQRRSLCRWQLWRMQRGREREMENRCSYRFVTRRTCASRRSLPLAHTHTTSSDESVVFSETLTRHGKWFSNFTHQSKQKFEHRVNRYTLCCCCGDGPRRKHTHNASPIIATIFFTSVDSFACAMRLFHSLPINGGRRCRCCYMCVCVRCASWRCYHRIFSSRVINSQCLPQLKLMPTLVFYSTCETMTIFVRVIFA